MCLYHPDDHKDQIHYDQNCRCEVNKIHDSPDVAKASEERESNRRHNDNKNINEERKTPVNNYFAMGTIPGRSDFLICQMKIGMIKANPGATVIKKREQCRIVAHSLVC
jgi:hypothetical protein